MLFKILREYLRRIMRNYKIYAISILGMCIAIIASFHIYHFVYKELSTDTFQTKRKEIYRVVQKYNNTNTFRSVNIARPLGALLKEKMPEVENYTRVLSDVEMKLSFNDISLKDNVSYIDASFFDLLDFSLKQGTVQHFSNTPNGVIISDKIAQTLFNGKNPIGEIVELEELYSSEKIELQIVGVMDAIPETSTIQGDYFINFKNIEKNPSTDDGNIAWVTTAGGALYLYMPNLTDRSSFSEKATKYLFDKMKTSAKVNFGEEAGDVSLSLNLQRLVEMYFDSIDVRE